MAMGYWKSVWAQWYPPPPTFTEKDVGNQTGKVFLITGANSGIGYELSKMLYPSGATIYMAGRSEERTREAMRRIQEAQPAPETPATLRFLQMDLVDFESIKSGAADFSSKEEKLDVLWNNAGIGGAPIGTTTAQDFEVHIGTNCLAPLLLTKLLLPKLRRAAENGGSARIVWSGSAMIDTHAVPGGLDWKAIEEPKTTNSNTDYASSKVGNWFLCIEAAKAYGPLGIHSVVQNPGNLRTQAYRYQTKFLIWILKTLVLYEARFGAYTLAYSGLSDEVENGEFVWPWGRKAVSPRKDIHDAIGKGAAERFWAWCEERVNPYAG